MAAKAKPKELVKGTRGCWIAAVGNEAQMPSGSFVGLGYLLWNLTFVRGHEQNPSYRRPTFDTTGQVAQEGDNPKITMNLSVVYIESFGFAAGARARDKKIMTD